jgi:uncharacterized protein YbjT (DUF2867 family)
MKILVIGGTGTVGTPVVETLLGRGADVRVMSRHLGARSGAEYVSGDLASPGTLGSSFESVSKLYLLTPLTQDEVELGMNAVQAAREHGVRHIVFQSIHRAEEAQEIPHFRTKVEIIEGTASTRLRSETWASAGSTCGTSPMRPPPRCSARVTRAGTTRSSAPTL